MTLLSIAIGLLGLGSDFVEPVASLPLQGDWRQAYGSALKAARLGHWKEARTDFQEADRLRPGDTDRPTISPGDPNEPDRWRNGSPYTPKFLSAYSEYRTAVDSQDPTEQEADFKVAQTEFEHLLDAGYRSRDTLFFLDLIYTRIGNQHQRDALHIPAGRHAHHNFKVDEDPLAPEEIASIQLVDFSSPNTLGSAPAGKNRAGSNPQGVTSPTIQAGALTTGLAGQTLDPIVPGLPLASVAPMGSKYALVIGEDGSQLGQAAMPFASYDAGVVKDGLINYAGYEPSHVVAIQNGSAAQVQQQAKALADRVGQDAVVLLFFSGPGVSVQGRDYLSASDTTSRFDMETMVAKADLYQMFFLKGARLFSFYEVNRPIENGFFFGSEGPKIGSVSQMEATIPDSMVTATVANGHMVGLFAQSFIEVLGELRSNQIPIYEFGWQCYNKMRRGDTGQAGGGGHQICTLPVLNNLASDARF
jgi:hypothetical protein